ncbi:MAG: DUF3052 family protein [Marinomonas sp.]
MTEPQSDKPLAIKLALRDGQICWFDGMPEHFIDEIDEYALELSFVADLTEIRLGGLDAAHIFVSDAADLEGKLTELRIKLAKDGQVWVSWRVDASLDHATVQTLGMAAGLISTKTLDLDADWSAVKLVIPKADR